MRVEFGSSSTDRPEDSAHGRIRTCDTWLRRPVLYPLSYVGDSDISPIPLFAPPGPVTGHYTGFPLKTRGYEGRTRRALPFSG